MDFEVLIYLLLIIAYVIFQFISGKIVKKSEKDSEYVPPPPTPATKKPNERRTLKEDRFQRQKYDPFIPADAETKKETPFTYEEYKRESEAAPKQEKKSTTEKWLEEFPALEELLKPLENKEDKEEEERIRTENSLKNKLKNEKRLEEERLQIQRDLVSQGSVKQRSTKKTQVKRRESHHFEFDPVKAIIYSEIINRKEW